jgi:hypothetical protein
VGSSDNAFLEVRADEARGLDAFGVNHARVYGVDANLLCAKLFREDSRDGVDGALGSGGDRAVRRRQAADDRTDIDDAGAFAKMLDCLLRGQQETEDVDVETFVVMLFGDVFDGGDPLARSTEEAYRIGARRSARLLQVPWATLLYKSRKKSQEPLIRRLREMAATHVRYGYRRLRVLLRRERWKVSAKRVYQLYDEDNLKVRSIERKKVARRQRVPQRQAAGLNQCWSADFVIDKLSDGRAIRTHLAWRSFCRPSVQERCQILFRAFVRTIMPLAAESMLTLSCPSLSELIEMLPGY